MDILYCNKIVHDKFFFLCSLEPINREKTVHIQFKVILAKVLEFHLNWNTVEPP